MIGADDVRAGFSFLIDTSKTSPRAPGRPVSPAPRLALGLVRCRRRQGRSPVSRHWKTPIDSSLARMSQGLRQATHQGRRRSGQSLAHNRMSTASVSVSGIQWFRLVRRRGCQCSLGDVIRWSRVGECAERTNARRDRVAEVVERGVSRVVSRGAIDCFPIIHPQYVIKGLAVTRWSPDF